MNKQHTKFIIVGAGISGLQAANNLAELNQDFIILQAQNHIGGRIQTVTIGQALKQDCITCNYSWLEKVKNTPIQIGATWICHQHQQIQQLASKYKIDLHPQYYKGKHILALNATTNLHLQEYQEYYAQYKEQLLVLIKKMWNLRDKFEDLLQLKKLNKISQDQLKQLQNIYNIYDSMSGYNFIQNELQNQFLSQLVDNQIETLQAISSKYFSALEFLIDDGGWHGIYYYLGVHRHNVDGYRAVQGLTALLNAMRDNIQTIFNKKGSKKTVKEVLKLDHPVIQVRNHLNPVQIVTQNGQILTCQKVLMCVPAGTLSRIKLTNISQGKQILFNNMLTSHTIRMTIVFPTPFWRKLNHSGNIDFSHQYPMNQLVELSPQDESCGVVAFVFFREGYTKWTQQIDQCCKKTYGEVTVENKYEASKMKALKIIANMFLQGNMEDQRIRQCVLFTRSLSQSPFIRNTYDSTSVPGTYKKLFEINQDHLNRFDCDQENVVMLGSDFWEVEEHSGYMQGGIRIANRKITKQFIEQCDKKS